MSLTALIPWPYRVLAIALLIAGTFAVGFIKGGQYEQGKQAVAVVADVKRIRADEKKARIETAKVADQGEARAEKVRIVYRDVIKEVIRYAETDNGRATCTGPDWVREHNRAANPEDLPAPGSEAAISAWQPSNAQTLGVVVANYETCNRWRDHLIGWQEWYRASGLEEK
jgi:hypothetical protein